MNSGTITLYFDGEFVASRIFISIANRKLLMQKMNETYQVFKQHKTVYYQLTA